MSREWYRFFINLYTLTGSGTSTISLTDLQVGPPADGTEALSAGVHGLEVLPPAISSDAAIATLQSSVDALYLTPIPLEVQTLRYGSFFDTTTQSTAANTPVALTYNTTDISRGVYIGTTTSRVYFTYAGVYNLQFSVQLENSDASLQDVDIWLRVDGVDVAGSNGKLSIQNRHGGVDGHDIKGWNFFLTLYAGQYVEIVWCPTSASVTIPYVAAAAGPPAIPATYSVVLTVSQVNLL
jgi:hypothetical protein